VDLKIVSFKVFYSNKSAGFVMKKDPESTRDLGFISIRCCSAIGEKGF